MTVEDLLVDPQPLRSLYGSVPELSEVRIRSIHLNWRGPTLTLRVDLPAFPESVPDEWIAAGVDTVQCQFEFLAVDKLLIAEWAPPVVGGLAFSPKGSRRRMLVTFEGRGTALEFESSESVRVAHVSAFTMHPDGSDAGRHLFLSKIDARRHDSLPETCEKTFYER